jgi:hypothetical protein
MQWFHRAICCRRILLHFRTVTYAVTASAATAAAYTDATILTATPVCLHRLQQQKEAASEKQARKDEEARKFAEKYAIHHNFYTNID